jgi:hypothetical protein
MRQYETMSSGSTKQDSDVCHSQVIIRDVKARMGYEIITIMNQGKEAQSLWGWDLATLDGLFIFKIPTGITLSPGNVLRVACGPQKSITRGYDLHWMRQKQLNAAWDVILLIDASGKVVDRYHYEKVGQRGLSSLAH